MRPAPKRPPRITIRRELRTGMVTPDYRVLCGAPTCEFEDKSDEMGAQRLARMHNNRQHNGACIVKYDDGSPDFREKARGRAVEEDE